MPKPIKTSLPPKQLFKQAPAKKRPSGKRKSGKRR